METNTGDGGHTSPENSMDEKQDNSYRCAEEQQQAGWCAHSQGGLGDRVGHKPS